MFKNAKKGDIAVMVDTDFSAHGDKDQLEIVLVDEDGIYVYDPNDRLLFQHESGVEFSFLIDFDGTLAGREPAIKEIISQ
jgi:hypothetical protein